MGHDLVSPDQGMPELLARMGGGGPDSGASVGADLWAGLAVSLGTVAGELQRGRDERRWANAHPLNLPPAQSVAAGTLDPPDSWQPRQGWLWRIEELIIALGAGATQASVYRDAPTPINLLLQTSTGGLWEPKRLLIMPGSRLVVTSVGGGVTVRIEGVEVSMAASYLVIT